MVGNGEGFYFLSDDADVPSPRQRGSWGQHHTPEEIDTAPRTQPEPTSRICEAGVLVKYERSAAPDRCRYQKTSNELPLPRSLSSR